MLPCLLFLVTILTTAVSGIPLEPVHLSTNDPSGLPAVGDIWGPVITHAGVMKDTMYGLLHEYGYPCPSTGPKGTRQEDVLVDYILPTEIFQNVQDMYKYIKSEVSNDFVVLQLDPAALEGKFLEVMSSKVIPLESVKMVCHSYKTKPAFCHDLADTSHKVRLMYSMVRDTDSGYLFPTLFASHQGCARENNQLECYWVTHVNEIVVLDKRVVKE